MGVLSACAFLVVCASGGLRVCDFQAADLAVEDCLWVGYVKAEQRICSFFCKRLPRAAVAERRDGGLKRGTCEQILLVGDGEVRK